MKYLRRGSGYYIDVGAADLVADGKIPVKHGQVVELTETGVKLDNGEELPADLVVYATGYGSMNGLAADIVGQEIADRVGKVWGLGSDTTKDPGPWEGEQRNMWKPTQEEGLWFHGGNLHQCATTRSTSRCSSRPGPRASRRRCTACRRCTTRPDATVRARPREGVGSRADRRYPVLRARVRMRSRSRSAAPLMDPAVAGVDREHRACPGRTFVRGPDVVEREALPVGELVDGHHEREPDLLEVVDGHEPVGDAAGVDHDDPAERPRAQRRPHEAEAVLTGVPNR